MGDGVSASCRVERSKEVVGLSWLYFRPGGNEVVGSSCVTFGKLLKLSALWFPHLVKWGK